MKIFISLALILAFVGCSDNLIEPSTAQAAKLTKPSTTAIVGQWSYQGLKKLEFTSTNFTLFSDKVNDWIPLPGTYSYVAGPSSGTLSTSQNAPYFVNGILPFNYTLSSNGLILTFNIPSMGVTYVFQKM